LTLLATVDESRIGNFAVRSWLRRTAVGERPVGVDQTNESVIVGGAAVVKWATHLQQGPHPAPHRISVLRDAGFDGMPAPWGLVTWRAPDGTETLVANVDEYLPGAVDGWTWAVDLLTEAAREHRPETATDMIRQLGRLIADMHDHLSATITTASAQDATRWRESANYTLETVCALGDSACVELTRRRRDDFASAFESLGEFAGTPVIEGHGDLHVGQILRSGDRLLVTDFDGNPVLPASQRALPIPAALDVAGMTQSLAIDVLDDEIGWHRLLQAKPEVEAMVRDTFLDAYASTLQHSELYDQDLLMPFRLQQVLREIIYAARHLPRWMYVPDAALPALLGTAI